MALGAKPGFQKAAFQKPWTVSNDGLLLASTSDVVSIHDVDFGGDRSFVYRLTVTPGPSVLGATSPATTSMSRTSNSQKPGSEWNG